MNNAYNSAIRLLARREYGAVELIEKLMQKGCDRQEATDALLECQRLGLQSDMRFAEQVCRTRVSQGYGPVRIAQELQAKRLDSALIDDVLAAESDRWQDCAKQVWQKKFKAEPARSVDALQKQRRFLLYRGFTGEVVARVLNDVE